MTYHYVRVWAESANGGASMLLDEYVTTNPPHPIGERREKQTDDKWSGWDCSRVEIAREQDLNELPIRSTNRTHKGMRLGSGNRESPNHEEH